MKSSVRMLSGVVLTAFSLAAQAQVPAAETSPWYGELGYFSVGISATDGVDVAKADPSMVLGTVGYQLHPNVAIEAFAGFGLQKDDVTLNGAATGLQAKASNTYGVFVKPSFRATEYLELFGRIGFARSKVALSVAGLSASESDNDTAWGLGANYHITPRSYLQWSWTQLYEKDGVDAKGWALSYGMKF